MHQTNPGLHPCRILCVPPHFLEAPQPGLRLRPLGARLRSYLIPQPRKGVWIVSPRASRNRLQGDLPRLRVPDLVADYYRARLSEGAQGLGRLKLGVPVSLVQDLRDQDDVYLALERLELGRRRRQDVGLDESGP